MPGAGRKRLRTRRARLRPHNSSPHCESEKYIELKRFWHEIAALNAKRLRKEAFQLMKHFHL